MRRTLFCVGAGIVLLAGCVGADRRAGYEVTMVVLPDGHPDSGRTAFLELGCTSCHAVEWEKELPPPIAAIEAPEIGKSVAATSSGMLATAIIAPSHYVPRQIREVSEGGLSPMGDFTETMTVRQLVDIVAYVKSHGEGGEVDRPIARYAP